MFSLSRARPTDLDKRSEEKDQKKSQKFLSRFFSRAHLHNNFPHFPQLFVFNFDSTMRFSFLQLTLRAKALGNVSEAQRGQNVHALRVNEAEKWRKAISKGFSE